LVNVKTTVENTSGKKSKTFLQTTVTDDQGAVIDQIKQTVNWKKEANRP